jgi:hypothetical protein
MMVDFQRRHSLRTGLRRGLRASSVVGALILTCCSSPSSKATDAQTTQVRAAKPTLDVSKEPQGFGGVDWGSTRREVAKLNPFGTCSCFDGSRYKMEDVCSASLKLGEADIGSSFRFTAGKVTSVELEYFALQFDLVKSILIEKYGAPSSDSFAATITEAGVPYQDETLVWNFPKVRIEAHRYGLTADRGITFLTLRSQLDSENRHLQETLKAAKDAF